WPAKGLSENCSYGLTGPKTAPASAVAAPPMKQANATRPNRVCHMVRLREEKSRKLKVRGPPVVRSRFLAYSPRSPTKLLLPGTEWPCMCRSPLAQQRNREGNRAKFLKNRTVQAWPRLKITRRQWHWAPRRTSHAVCGALAAEPGPNVGRGP